MGVFEFRRWIDLTIGIVAVAVSFGGCTATKNATAEAASATTVFHARFNSEEFRKIYNGADEAFRQAGTEEQMETFPANQRRQLGDFQTADAPSYTVNYTTQETIVTLTYRSTFAHGHAQEQFVWVVISGTAKLRKYWMANIELTRTVNVPAPMH